MKFLPALASIFLLSCLTHATVPVSQLAPTQITVNNQECSESARKLAPLTSAANNRHILHEIKTKKPKVIVLGEYHYSHYFWKLPHIYRFLQKLLPDMNCLYTEISNDATASDLNDIIQGKSSRAFPGQYRLGFGTIYEEIKELNSSIVPVDAPVQEMIDKKVDGFNAWVSHRDDRMVETIMASLESGRCRVGLYNVGSRHIRSSDSFAGQPYKSFASKLKDKLGDEVIVIDQAYLEDVKQNANCDSMPDSQKYFSGFLARVSDVPKDLFTETEWAPTVDYVLFLHPWETMHTMLYVSPTEERR